MLGPDLAVIAMDPTEQLIRALERLTTRTARSVFKPPSFNGEGEVELFVERFDEVTMEN